MIPGGGQNTLFFEANALNKNGQNTFFFKAYALKNKVFWPPRGSYVISAAPAKLHVILPVPF